MTDILHLAAQILIALAAIAGAIRSYLNARAIRGVKSDVSTVVEQTNGIAEQAAKRTIIVEQAVITAAALVAARYLRRATDPPPPEPAQDP